MANAMCILCGGVAPHTTDKPSVIVHDEGCLNRNGDLWELLADVEHKRWAKWQRYLHSVCVRNEDGSLTIPESLVRRWERQINTAYVDLSRVEQEADIREADVTIRVLAGLLRK